MCRGERGREREGEAGREKGERGREGGLLEIEVGDEGRLVLCCVIKYN